MTTPLPLTRDIGQAERSLRVLLEHRLERAGLSFPEWTVLTFLADSTGTTRDALVQRQVAGHITSETGARATVERLLARGLVGATTPGLDPAARHDDPPLATTPAGRAVFEPLRDAVIALTQRLHADLPPADVHATRRTLGLLAERARALARADD